MRHHEIDANFYIENVYSVFAHLTPEDREQIKEHCTWHRYRKGDIIFKEGDKPAGLVILVSGKIKLFKEGVGGREQIVRMSRPSSMIGYRALFAEENYISSVQAIEESIICVVDKATLYRIMRSNIDMTFAILKAVASELGFSTNRTVTLTQKHIRGRLAESLVFLKETYGYEDDGATLKVYLSREDLANLSNMTTSNAIRTLSSFASEDIIHLDGRRIKILDFNKLERISELG
ncbi:Crp/Fnr family transcriptional regulator [Alistipes sp. ZOR0009]|jgi:CRP-like cAMP-binding protein|uniref:Crp/Fnr family transcriptional regulator n=1 Tax=Alistipes sp. ZOR0009 TaxID=1339253 RepID=UPI0006486622|nr:Crp/Fnr family transcriptional regulator [Alistipes sp. ZOR0009]